MTTSLRLARAVGILIILLAINLSTGDSAKAQIVIDDFEANQTVTNAGPTVVSAASGIIGLHRTGRIMPMTSTSTLTIGSGTAAFSNDVTGSAILEWDGDTDATTYSETGLVGINLTTDGSMAQVGICFHVVTVGPFAGLLEISTDANYASAAAFVGNGPLTVVIPFGDFVSSGPLGAADFTSVGAILMVFSGEEDYTIGPITTKPDGNLPVELVSFEAVANGPRINLSWNVASETDNSGFFVEHRMASANESWSDLAFVPSLGNTSEGASYGYGYDSELAGRHYFRLRQVDLDGSVSYSPIVEVSVDVPGSFLLGDAYPNPFNPTTNFTLSVASSQRVTIGVFDLLGRRVLTLHDGLLEGGQSHVFRMDADRMTTGTYLVKAVGETESATIAVTLVK